ncbi:hypothetical protein DFJ43DRAFT_1108843 [Lentinula guzmanii]|uniref:F-box domain-containing protein n=1 Tax=Lentinula guzmanii TaxID=2804957 RepID=A0AA38J927_9AGAR|nr:hypothetical protein DFJ43DRAFT_1108843 [Lentinula guzmanii]
MLASTSANHSWDTSRSPFASMIGTNYVPTSSEVNQLQELLAPFHNELLRLDSEIHHFRTILDGLLQEKQQVERYIEAHKALMSPVQQLPSETLSEIFKWCLPVDPSYAVRNIYQAPLVLTTICRAWRRTAINTPALWSSLHVYLPPHLSKDRCSRRINGIRRWLKRSGSLPLSISFHGSTTLTSEASIPCYPDENMELMIDTLMQFSHRFSDLFLSLSSTDFSAFCMLAPTDLPLLRSLQVRDEDLHRGKIRDLGPEAGEMHNSNFSTLLSRIPSLKQLKMYKFPVAGDKYSSLPCNWKNITKLEILATLDPDQVLTILSSTPKMESVTLSIGLSTPHIFRDLHVIHLSHLNEMKLTFLRLFTQASTTMHRPDIVSAFESEITSIFDCIQCTTTLHSFRFLCHHILLSRLPFIGLPLHALETLELTMPMTAEMMAECISKTPSLVNFQLTDLDDVSTGPQLHADPLQELYLVRLTPSSTDPTPSWWPKLQNIRILSRLMSPYAYRYDSVFSPTTLTTFIKARSEKYIPRLKSCDILFRQRPAFSAGELEILRNLKKDVGLKLRLNGARCPSVWEFGPDSPDTGLVEPPNVSKLSDMECVFGTDIIV